MNERRAFLPKEQLKYTNSRDDGQEELIKSFPIAIPSFTNGWVYFTLILQGLTTRGISCSVARENLCKGDLALVGHFCWNVRRNGKIRRVLAPKLGYFGLTSEADFPRIT